MPAEILEVEKLEEPIQKRIVDMIIELEITKLVIGFSVMKPSWYSFNFFPLHRNSDQDLKFSEFLNFSVLVVCVCVYRKSRGAISGLFYIHQHKPEFCEMFILCGGKQVFMRGQHDEKIMEDDNGVVVAKMRDKITFKDWIEKLLPERNNLLVDSADCSSSSAIIESSVGSQNQWEIYHQEIETYYQILLSTSNMNIGEQVRLEHQESDVSGISGLELDDVREYNNSNDQVSLETMVSLFQKKKKRNNGFSQIFLCNMWSLLFLKKVFYFICFVRFF